MDELEKQTPAPEQPEADTGGGKKRKNDDNRRRLMYLLCGGYLVYLAIKMLKDYPGLTGSERTVSLCGGIGFLLIGGALLVLTAIRAMRTWKQENEQTEETEHGTE